MWIATNSLNYLGPRQSKTGYQTGPHHHGSGSKDGSLPKASVIITLRNLLNTLCDNELAHRS